MVTEAFSITLLSKDTHDIRGFDCGEPELDSFLQDHAAADALNDISKTYVD